MMDAVQETVIYEVPEPGIVQVTLNRPEQMNAYTPRMCDELAGALQRFWHDDAARVLVITGRGRAFCAGGDIGAGTPEFRAALDAQLGRAQELNNDMHRVNRLLFDMDKPVIAMVNGAAVAGGLALALLCDYRIAARSAKVGDPSGRAGLLPDEGGAWLFPRFMGYDQALRMWTLSEVYSAERGHQLGLLSEVVPDDELTERTFAYARQVAGAAPIALRMTKRMMRRGMTSTFESSLGDAQLAVLHNNISADTAEGRLAFAERRSPRFTGR